MLAENNKAKAGALELSRQLGQGFPKKISAVILLFAIIVANSQCWICKIQYYRTLILVISC